MRTRMGAALLMVVGLLVVVAGPGQAATELEGASDERPLGTADRVLVFTVPTLSWSDLERVEAPHLEGLLSRSAVGDLSVRSVSRRTSAVDGYATLNAGTRAEGTQQASLAFVAGLTRGTDGDPTNLPAEAFDPEPANEDVDAGPVPAPAPDPADPATLAPEAGENYDGSPAAEGPVEAPWNSTKV